MIATPGKLGISRVSPLQPKPLLLSNHSPRRGRHRVADGDPRPATIASSVAVAIARPPPRDHTTRSRAERLLVGPTAPKDSHGATEAPNACLTDVFAPEWGALDRVLDQSGRFRRAAGTF
jgi:hypothetical protein